MRLFCIPLMLNIQQFIIPADSTLTPFVECFWMLANPSGESKPVVVLPDGRVDVHFYISPTEPFNTAIAGLDYEPTQRFIEPFSCMAAVSFKLLAVEYILQDSLAGDLNQRRTLDNNFGGITAQDLTDFPNFCAKLSAHIQTLLPQKIDAKKQQMFELIYSTNGSISVSEIAETIHWSSRQINRYFNQWFGISLKKYCNILRFRASLPQLQAGKFFPDGDFTDQAHFIKEIKKYSGATPKELARNQNDRFIQLLKP